MQQKTISIQQHSYLKAIKKRLMYDYYKNEYYVSYVAGDAHNALTDNKVLFYVMGTWAMSGTAGPDETEEYGMVYIPKCPDTDEYYVGGSATAYMWAEGSSNIEPMKAWFTCTRMEYTQPEYLETARAKNRVNNPNWSDQMFEITEAGLDGLSIAFDIGNGISTLAEEDINFAHNKTGTEVDGTIYTWAQTRAAYADVIDREMQAMQEIPDSYS